MLSLCVALQEFRDTNGRDPEGEGDREPLMKALEAVTKKLGVNSDLVPDNFYKLLHNVLLITDDAILAQQVLQV